MHFCWKDRKSGVVEDDLIIFPDDVEYKKVPQCTTGRAYILKFKSSTRKFFFWMQEPKTDKDDEYCTKINESLNNPPTPGSSRSNVSTPANLPSELSNLVSGETDLQNLLSGMSQQQLISLLSGGSVGGSLSGLLGNRRGASTRSRTAAAAAASASETPTSAPAASPAPAATPAAAPAPAESPAAGSPAVQLSDLRSILSNMNVPQPGAEQAAGGEVDLSAAMTAEALQPVLSNPAFLERLQTFLPSIGNNEQLPSAQNLRGTLQSPQFQQALSLFSSALQSGQLAPVISQFDLGEAAVTAASAGDLGAFVRALQQQQKKDDDMATE